MNKENTAGVVRERERDGAASDRRTEARRPFVQPLIERHGELPVITGGSFNLFGTA